VTEPAPETNRPAGRLPAWLRAILILSVVGWIAWLAGLAVETANPVSLNRAQILAADVVVEGRWLDRTRSRLEVHRVWKRPTMPREITIRELPALAVPREGPILLPLTRIGRTDYRLTNGEIPNPPGFGGPERSAESKVRPMGYPATEDSIRELEQVLRR
jgi:hypothetical protein